MQSLQNKFEAKLPALIYVLTVKPNPKPATEISKDNKTSNSGSFDFKIKQKNEKVLKNKK